MVKWQKVVWIATTLLLIVAAPVGTFADSRLPDDFFPISFWGNRSPSYDSLSVFKAVVMRQHGQTAGLFGDKWYGSILKALDEAEDVGDRLLVWTDHDTTGIRAKRWWGHYVQEGTYFWKHPDTLQIDEPDFADTVRVWVEYWVDQLADKPALLGYHTWDEPDGHHRYAVIDDTVSVNADTVNNYYYSLFFKDDTIGTPAIAGGKTLDSLSVYSLIQHELHEQDTTHLTFVSLGGGLGYEPRGSAWFRAVCDLKCDTGATSVPNPPDCFGTANHTIMYNHNLGDPVRFHKLAGYVDLAVAADTSYGDGRVPVWKYVQCCGFSGSDVGSPDNLRMLTPEELRCITNLSLEHGAKGLLYWRSGVWPRIWPDSAKYYAGLLAENGIPFDAPYEEYVYYREHDRYWNPDGVKPFGDGFEDPFAPPLGPEPDTSGQDPRLLEEHCIWKYEPYARRFNALTDLNADVHRMGYWLLEL